MPYREFYGWLNTVKLDYDHTDFPWHHFTFRDRRDEQVMANKLSLLGKQISMWVDDPDDDYTSDEPIPVLKYAPYRPRRAHTAGNNQAIDVEAAIGIIDEWLSRKPDYYWSNTPTYVCEQLRAAGSGGMIEYHLARAILDSAKTMKLHGMANRGIEHIAQQWRAIRVPAPIDAEPL